MAFIPRLRAFAGPTLILNGAGDRLMRGGEERFLAAAADGRLVIIDGADHVPSEEAPEAWNAAVRQFAEELDSR
jgi:pimeloyl-ACP methyl ester carboxylesterase